MHLDFNGPVDGQDMGDVTITASNCRVHLGGQAFAVVSVQATFVGDDGDATMSMKVDHHDSPELDHIRYAWDNTGVGTGNNRVSFHVPEDERFAFKSEHGDPFVFERDGQAGQTWTLSVQIEALS